MKVIFMGTPDFAVPSLEKLIDSEHEVVCVYTQAPKEAGRGQKIKKSPIHELAEINNIPVRYPKSLKSVEEHNLFSALNADIGVIAAYGLLLPKAILDAPKYGCINTHPSLLPRWRGAAPIQRAIIEGDRKTGLCIMQMDEGLDTGDILSMQQVDIPPKATAASMHDILSNIGSDCLLQTMYKIADGTINSIPQSSENIKYADKLQKSESMINWNEPASKIDCKIRGLTTWPGAYFRFNNVNIKIIEAEYIDMEHNKRVGEVIDDELTIACEYGCIKLLKIQRPGKKPMDTKDFLNGTKISQGTMLR